MEDMLILNAYKNLASAIVFRAAQDYRWAFKKYLKTGRKNYEVSTTLSKCTAFFRSEWFSVLCDYDPDKLMKGIETQCYKNLGFKTI